MGLAVDATPRERPGTQQIFAICRIVFNDKIIVGVLDPSVNLGHDCAFKSARLAGLCVWVCVWCVFVWCVFVCFVWCVWCVCVCVCVVCVWYVCLSTFVRRGN
jgi:hypothetical protein